MLDCQLLQNSRVWLGAEQQVETLATQDVARQSWVAAIQGQLSFRWVFDENDWDHIQLSDTRGARPE